MMYISIFPIAISLRRTNVYEEKSLGIYPVEEEDDDDDDETKNAPNYIGAHLRKQLSFDLWYVFLGLFIIAIAEGGPLRSKGKPDFQLFTVLFEVVSSYGTVGLSLGYPNTNASFSAQFNVISKLVIIAMQLRGRHRGLPYSLDRAILLPTEHQHHDESEDPSKRLNRRTSTMSGLSRQRSRSQSQQQQQQDAGLTTGMEAHDHAVPSSTMNYRDRRQSSWRS